MRRGTTWCQRTGWMLMVGVLALLGSTVPAEPAAAATSTPSLALTSDSIPRGGSTTFSSSFSMSDDATAQATVNRATELNATFDATCTTQSFGACFVSPEGVVTVSNEGSPGPDTVQVSISGSITATHNFALSSTEGVAGMTPIGPTGITITLNQGGSPQTSAPTPLTVTANAATDAQIATTTTAPAAGGEMYALPGTTVTYAASLTRTGVMTQVTQGTVSLVPVGEQVGAPSASQVVTWQAEETTKDVVLTVAVPSDIPAGTTGSYRVDVTYDPNADGGSVLDTEVGALRSFTVDTAPAITQMRPKPGSTVSDRTPEIAATVRDSLTDLAKPDISLRVDGVLRSNFDYDPSTDRLTWTPSRKLARATHSVKIQAVDAQGLTGQRRWSFRIK